MSVHGSPINLNTTTTSSSDRAKTLNARALVTDTTANNNYLTLLSSPYDIENPNHGDDGYIYDDSAGTGSTIFIIDSGFNVAAYPYEFNSINQANPRSISTWLPPRSVRSRGIGPEDPEGTHYPPEDTMNDVGRINWGGDKRIHGHGTQVAILAGGFTTGVARNANMFLIKDSEVLLDKNNVLWASEQLPGAQLSALQHIIQVLDDPTTSPAIPSGKAVVLITWSEPIVILKRDYNDYYAIKAAFQYVLVQLDQRGVTVVISAGNTGTSLGEPGDPLEDNQPHYTDELLPQALAGPDSPIIVVGAVTNIGQLFVESTPGKEDCPVALYASGKAIKTYDLADGVEPQDGTSLSASIVAGLAAYVLAVPANQDRFKYSSDDQPGSTVGSRVKKYLNETLSYQRVADDDKYDEEEEEGDYRYPLPNVLNVAYNNAHGYQ